MGHDAAGSAGRPGRDRRARAVRSRGRADRAGARGPVGPRPRPQLAACRAATLRRGGPRIRSSASGLPSSPSTSCCRRAGPNASSGSPARSPTSKTASSVTRPPPRRGRAVSDAGAPPRRAGQLIVLGITPLGPLGPAPGSSTEPPPPPRTGRAGRARGVGRARERHPPRPGHPRRSRRALRLAPPRSGRRTSRRRRDRAVRCAARGGSPSQSGGGCGCRRPCSATRAGPGAAPSAGAPGPCAGRRRTTPPACSRSRCLHRCCSSGATLAALDAEHAVAVVGTRHPTEAGRALAMRLGGAIAMSRRDGRLRARDRRRRRRARSGRAS